MDPTLARLADTLGDARTLADLTRPMLQMLENVTGFESVYLTTIDLSAGQQHIQFAHNAHRMQIPEGLTVPWEDTLCRRAMEAGIRATDDVPGRWPEAAAAKELGIQSYASTPVNAGDRLVGTLCAASGDARPLNDDGRQLMQLFATLIGRQVEREAMVAQLRRANAELSSFALTDTLTGLANRRALLAELPRMMARAQRDDSCVHVAFIDLDGFKQINDTHGHDVGDAFLKAVATRLLGALRSGDLLARYGGDEFVVIAASADEAAIVPVRERLAAATRGHYALPGIGIDYPGASVGVATAAYGEAIDLLLARADEAMYAAKRSRRNGDAAR